MTFEWYDVTKEIGTCLRHCACSSLSLSLSLTLTLALTLTLTSVRSYGAKSETTS